MQKLLLAIAFALPTAAYAQGPLPSLDQKMPGPHTQVLVLGSVHLNELPAPVKPEALQPLVDRLAAYKPDLITIEAIPGEQCDLVARHPDAYVAEDFAPYCASTAQAKAATGLDVPAAIAQARRLLKEWPADPAPAQRRRLAALFLAAGERASALVQWLQLPADERKAGDGLDATLAAQLDKLAAGTDNEGHVVGARLAARLGLQRVYAVDDHTGDNVQIDDAKAYGTAIQQAWNAAADAVKADRERREALAKAGDMLALYRFVNQPDVLRRAIESDFGAALRETSAQHYGRLYVAGWEARNLRMVANIRVAFRERPGVRVLSIVGATHKPWFDGLLGQMQGVEIVDAEAVLK